MGILVAGAVDWLLLGLTALSSGDVQDVATVLFLLATIGPLIYLVRHAPARS